MTTRRHLLISLSALPLLGFGLPVSRAFAQAVETSLAGDTITTANGELVVHPVQHASLLLGWRDQVIYVDPVGGGALYGQLPSATAVVVTHANPDHFDVPTLEAVATGSIPLIVTQEVFDQLPDALKVNATVMANGDEGSLNGLSIAAIPAYNTTPDKTKYHPQGAGNGYLIKFADKIVYVAGDTEATPEMLALKNIDLAFIPINQPYTMTVQQAADAINTFKPKIAYPYHYKGTDISGLDALVGDEVEVRLLEWYANG
ncbi:MBL fold metallo-hydrolase [Devosia sp.]|uniref:MBL fold metallo-hydrolase n=1 Tax=Devosia sp. TaxID=1871048 RepID=UPI00326578B7